MGKLAETVTCSATSSWRRAPARRINNHAFRQQPVTRTFLELVRAGRRKGSTDTTDETTALRSRDAGRDTAAEVSEQRVTSAVLQAIHSPVQRVAAASDLRNDLEGGVERRAVLCCRLALDLREAQGRSERRDTARRCKHQGG
jgi:hypothetical protein